MPICPRETDHINFLNHFLTTKRTFLTTLGIVALWNPIRVFHSWPSGISSVRSNCARPVYGNGRSFVRYFWAFLSVFSLMMTCALPWSARCVGSMPGIVFNR